MSRAPQPSFVTLPSAPHAPATLFAFLCARFPGVPPEVWAARLAGGAVTDDAGRALSATSPYQPRLRVLYYREVAREPAVPFEERVLFRDERLVVAWKPHFLPVVPSGPYVNECLLYRLRRRCGCDALVALHRLDRETAGLVMFSADPASRERYSRLFRRGAVRKEYEALGTPPHEPARREWYVESRIVRGEPWFRSREVDGPPNARSRIRVLEAGPAAFLYGLEPVTGKQHQLRLHMNRIGSRIVNDRYYPELQPRSEPPWGAPLQLLARRLSFRDPVTGEAREFECERTLAWSVEGGT